MDKGTCEAPGLVRAMGRAAEQIKELRALRAIDQETIERLTKEVQQSAKDGRILQANLDRALLRCAMVGAVAESIKRICAVCYPAMATEATDILTILDLQVLPEYCHECEGPVLHGDGVKCEWCGERLT